MFGVITRRDLFKHPVTVYRDYGWRVLFVGLFLHRGTFLDLVARLTGSRKTRHEFRLWRNTHGVRQAFH